MFSGNQSSISTMLVIVQAGLRVELAAVLAYGYLGHAWPTGCPENHQYQYRCFHGFDE